MGTTNSKLAGALAIAFAGWLPASAPALDLSGASWVTYGDGNSYALQVEGTRIGQTGPGSIYYVNSTPGAIKDLIVVATGASGAEVTTNVAGLDNALSTPSGKSGSNWFSGVWNGNLAAFTGALTVNGTFQTPIFFFNNNQTKSGATVDQNLAIWVQVTLTGAGQAPIVYDFLNRNSPFLVPSPYRLFTEGGGGVFEGDPALYTHGVGPVPPVAGTNASTDYVLSGGAVCLSTGGPVPVGAPVSCTYPFVSAPIDNNLGANQAAYAVIAPELDAFLAAWVGGAFQGYTDIHIDLRMGCDPATDGGAVAGAGSCIGRDLNNGYEQLFIGPGSLIVQVPEPDTIALLGLGLLGLLGIGAVRRRRKIA